jgi:tetratricopeptide (TPR) repeat protein
MSAQAPSAPLPTSPPDAAALTAQALREERLGHWDESAALFAQSFRAAMLAGEPAAAADALRGQARIRLQQRRYDEAGELADLSREIAGRHGETRAVARGTNVLALVRYACGDLDGAREMHEAALNLAVDVGDDELIGMACLNLGVVASVQGDLRGARVRFLESIGSSVRSGDKRSELMAYNNLGGLSGILQEWMEAQVYLDRGIEIAQRIGDQAPLARLSINRAEALIQLGETQRARDSLEECARLAAHLADREVAADLVRLGGMLARAEGAVDEARRLLREAIDLSLAGGLDFKRAESLREMGLLLAQTGEDAEADRCLAAARRLFAGMGATHQAAQVDGIAARRGTEKNFAA